MNFLLLGYRPSDPSLAREVNANAIRYARPREKNYKPPELSLPAECCSSQVLLYSLFVQSFSLCNRFLLCT
jgi:hypothetical protein